MKKIILSFFIFGALSLAGVASAQIGMMGGYGSGWNMMGGWGFGGWITTILIWVLLILGIVAAVKWLRKK